METLYQPAVQPPTSRRMKARAPPPPVPPAALKSHEEQKPSTDARITGDQSPADMKENMLNRKVDITIILPTGAEKTTTVEGSKAMMDLLVELCSRYHLNPAHHTLQITSSETQVPMKFKPNTLLGTLDVHTVFLKEKIPEGKTKRPPPRIPEKSVRLVVNFLRTQKTVLRVNPQVPLLEILPAICEKCEFREQRVILLKDNVTKDELDLSKSLNDLGIKELYAWNSERETNRNLSVRSDSIEKEKKGLLGIFRVHRRSNKTAEHAVRRLDSDDADEEVFELQTRNVAGLEGFSTVPNSPSVNPRTVPLGTSLSLTNISGMTERVEVKKRRAPPPPSAVTRKASASEESGEDKISVEMLQSSQNDLQKKKRRAPAPPAPVTEEKENQDSAIAGWHFAPGNSVYIDDDDDDDDVVMDILEGEETTSMNSCLAWDGTTEDSGTVSSRSDITSLDLQDDSAKPQDKQLWGPEDTVDTDVTYTAKMCPVRNVSVNSDDSWTTAQSSEERMAVRNGDEDLFITAQFHETLAELDEDSEDMEDNYSYTHGLSESSPTTEAPSPCQEDAESATDVAVAVPVTIIDEVPELNYCSLKSYVANAPSSRIDTAHTSSKDLEPLGKPRNENNNGSSFDKESAVSRTRHTNGELAYPQSPDAKSRFRFAGGDSLQSQRASFDNEVRAEKTWCTSEHVVTSGEHKPKVPSPTSSSAQESTISFFDQNGNDRSWNKNTMESELGHVVGKNSSEHKAPVLRWQQSYEPKPGLTTFKVVPPKPGVKQYDRGVSLSSSAIKIDELGNLINPQAEADKKDTSDSSADDTEGSLVRRAKAFWRSNSADKPLESPTDQVDRKPLPTPSIISRNQETESKSIFLADAKEIASHPPTFASKMDRRYSEHKETQPPLVKMADAKEIASHPQMFASKMDGRYSEHKETQLPLVKMADAKEVASHPPTFASKMDRRYSEHKETQPPLVKMPTAPELNTARGELSFLKPYRRTSSQYVASAITRHTKPLSQSSDIEKCRDEEMKHEDRNPAAGSEPKERKCVILSKYIPVETQQDEIRGSYQNYNSYTNKEWNTIPRSYDSGLESNGNNVYPLHERNIVKISNTVSAEPPKTLSKDHIIQRVPAHDARHETADGESNTFHVQKYETGDGVDFPPVCVSPTASLPYSSSHSFTRTMQQRAQNSADNMYVKHTFGTDSAPTSDQVSWKTESKPVVLPRSVSLESEILVENSVFGPKKKFRPVVQKPAQKDISPHGALMESIQSGEGKHKLRSVQGSGVTNESHKKASFIETENERSALLSAIRAHSGNSRLKKISSSAAEELQSIRNAELQLQKKENRHIPPPPIMPPPPPPPPIVPATAPTFSAASSGKSVNAREQLMEAIRSGSSAARLKKVSPSLNTL